MVLGSMLWSSVCILLLVYVMGDSCHKGFDNLGYIQGSKIVVLQ